MKTETGIAEFVEKADHGLDRPLDSDFKRFEGLESGDPCTDLLLKALELWNAFNIPAKLEVTDTWCALVTSNASRLDVQQVGEKLVNFSARLAGHLCTCSTTVGLLSLTFDRIRMQFARALLAAMRESFERTGSFRGPSREKSPDPNKVVDTFERVLTGGQSISECTNRIDRASARLVETLASVGPSLVPFFVKYLGEHKGDDKGFRHMCTLIDVLGRLGKNANPGTPLLVELMQKRTDEVGEAAVVALGDIEDPRALPAICERIKNHKAGKEEDKLLQKCVGALGRFGRGAEQALPLFTELIETRTDDVRMMAIDALGDIGSEKALPFLAEIRDSKKLLSFLRVGDSKYRFPAEMREAAHRAIRRISGKK